MPASRSADFDHSDSGSGLEDLDEQLATTLQGLEGNPEAQRYLAGMMKAQQEVGKLTAQVKALQAEVYELKLSSARKSGAARTKADRGASSVPSASANSGAGSVSASATTASATTAPNPDKAVVAAIKRLGHYGQLECSPVLSAAAFGHPKPLFRHDSPKRYANENIAFGFTADLYYCVPPSYYEKIVNNSDAFHDTFLSGLSMEVANTVLALRNISGELTGIPQSAFHSKDPKDPDYVSRASLPQIRELLGITTMTEMNPDGKVITNDLYADIPPFLYHPDHPNDPKFLFQNPLMFQYAKAVIYGPSMVNHPKPKLRSTGTYKHADGRPLQASSGIIAGFSAYIHYTLSPDTEFGGKAIGDLTGIDYGAKHAMYRRLLIEGRGTKAIARTFRVWNEKVFPMTRHGCDAEDAMESEDDHAERQRQARDGAQPVHNILAAIRDSSSDDGSGSDTPDAGDDNTVAQSNRKGKGVDCDATFTMESLSISVVPTRPTTPISDADAAAIIASHRAVQGGDALLNGELQVDPYYVAHADLHDFLNKTLPPQASTSQPSLPRSRALMRRPMIISTRQAQVSHSTVTASTAASLSVAPPVMATFAQRVAPPVVSPVAPASAPPVVAALAPAQPAFVAPAPAQSVVIAPAARRTSNRGKPATGTSEAGSGQAAESSKAAGRGRGGKAGKKPRGA